MLDTNKIHCGDCQTVMRDIDSDSVDCIVTDPPYGLSFMGKDWDKAVPSIEIWQECLRVLKPGAFAFVMCIPRQDCLARMICRLEDAGFNVAFSSIYHTFASGFPKAQNLSKAVDKRPNRLEALSKIGKIIKEYRLKKKINLRELGELCNNRFYRIGGTVFYETGKRLPSQNEWNKLKEVLEIPKDYDYLFEEAEREVIGKDGRTAKESCFGIGIQKEWDITISATPQAKALEGAYSGCQLKPAVEVIIVVMKPREEKTYLNQALKNGHGATWLGDCLIPFDKETEPRKRWCEPSANREFARHNHTQVLPGLNGYTLFSESTQKGRFPANVLCEDDVLDDGIERKSSAVLAHHNRSGNSNLGKTFKIRDRTGEYANWKSNSGGYSRYFSLDAWFEERIKQLPEEAQKTFPFMIIPKASKGEKDRGLKGESNIHPTCKPIKLMSWLITLASREGDTVLDPFCGSGTTAIAAKMLDRQYIGIEREEDYCETARKRVAVIPTNLSNFR